MRKISETIAGGEILILDGAMGTMIQRYGLQEQDFHSGIFSGCPKELKGNNECLNLTRPEIIRAIHEEYINAGADIIETNTFSANRISQEEYGCAEYAFDMAYAGARIAREAAESCSGHRKIYVAGSIGPTSKSLSLSPDMNDPAFRAVSFDEMAEAYGEQMRGLLLGGVDLILLETCFDALNVKAALYALEKLMKAPDISENAGIRERLSKDGHFPVIVSVSVSDRSGRTLTGQTLEAFYTSVRHYPLTAFGLNCSLGAEEIYPLLKEVSNFAECAVSCYPNAGLPDGMGGYAETPAEMAAAIRKMAADGLVNIIGGCCGTTPDYIREIAGAVKGLSARKNGSGRPGSETGGLAVSGLETVHIDLERYNFTNIGERANVAGSRKFARLISSGNYAEAMQVAADQIENGASVIDINMDDAMLDSTREMTMFTRHISNDPAVAKAALMIDSSHWETILAGLKNAQGKSIVNSISLKEGEDTFLEKAREIHALGAAMVVMAFDEKGQATDFGRKTEICGRAYRLLTEKAGIPPEDIIFDVNVLAVGTGIEEHADYAVDFICAVGWIKENLPGALTSGGISNLSFSFRGNNPVREAMHSAFLYHAIKAGLDMAIVNPGMLQIYDEIEPSLLKCVEDVILNTDAGATERLIEKAQEIAEEKVASGMPGKTGPDAGGSAKGNGGNAAGASGSEPDMGKTAEERLMDALVKGRATSLEEDLWSCLEKYGRPVDIIEGPLMDGMKKVGELFGSGKMFLPQVVKSAKIMRQAVDFLQPYMDGQENSSDGNMAGKGNKEHKEETASDFPAGHKSGKVAVPKPKIVIATVKGDVHDIGKNITSIVLGCNGFDVIDLGVMVDKETIIGTAISEKADIIAASGLITPSLFQMEELCRAMSEKGMDTPLFIGGATTSPLHTAVKLAPLYGHVFYGADASASAVMAKRCMMDREAFENEEHEKQQKIRELYLKGMGNAVQDRNGAPGMTDVSDTTCKDGHDTGSVFPPESYMRSADCMAADPDAERKVFCLTDISAGEISIAEVLPYFDWKMFFAIWGVKYGQMSPDAPEMADLKKEAEEIIQRMESDGSCRIMLAAKWFEAFSAGDDIHLTERGKNRLSGMAADGDGQDKSPDDRGKQEVIFPMMRQEKPSALKDGTMACLSLADFVPPAGYGFTSPAGIFAISVSRPASHRSGCGCPACKTVSGYDDMMERSVMNTLAEAASAWLDGKIGKMIENAENAAADGKEFKIIKPAAGYSSCPDHTLKRDILRLLPDSCRLGITLTESCGMIPDASICGMIFIHRNASFPDIHNIGRRQYDSYARRRGMTEEEAKNFLGHLL